MTHKNEELILANMNDYLEPTAAIAIRVGITRRSLAASLSWMRGAGLVVGNGKIGWMLRR